MEAIRYRHYFPVSAKSCEAQLPTAAGESLSISGWYVHRKIFRGAVTSVKEPLE
jgi:hypothetical protein